MDCEGYINRRVKLGYVADSPTSIQLVDSIGNQVFDLLPVIQAGETDTSIKLIRDTRRIRYYPEKYTRTEGKEGCFYDICMQDLASLIYLNDLADVNVPNPATGGTIIYDATQGAYVPFDLAGAIARLDGRIDDTNIRIDGLTGNISTINNNINELTRRINSLTETVSNLNEAVENLTARLTAIENAIYNWSSDKNTKIARGNINVTSGGYTSGNGIYTRTPDTNEDLNFS